MKKLRQILTFVVAFCMMFQCSLLSVFADDEYTYTVTFYAGNQGTFADGAGKIVMSNLKYGAFVSFDVQKDGVVTLNNSDKYYVKGLRKSGRDNSETDELEASRYSVMVKGDADYVVAYGIKGNQVAYTVNYQDADGKELLASNTYYGNVGDKPVVAYQYVEGYTPQALALTKTLSENSAENVFTFRYTPIGTTVVTIPGETTTVTTVVPGTTNVETITVPATTSAGTTTGTGTTGTGTTGTAQRVQEQPVRAQRVQELVQRQKPEQAQMPVQRLIRTTERQEQQMPIQRLIQTQEQIVIRIPRQLKKTRLHREHRRFRI